jgi:hypothetical protein
MATTTLQPMYRTLLLSAHLIAVAAWLGGDLVLLVLGRSPVGDDAGVVALWYDRLASLSRTYFNAAGITVAVTGVLLVLRSDYSWGASFISLGLFTVIAAAVLGMVVIGPTARRAAHAYRGGATSDPDARQSVDLTVPAQLSTRLSVIVGLDALLVVITLVAMVDRWGA